MKSRGMNRLICFRPVCDEDGADGGKIKPVGKTKSIYDPLFTYVSVSKADLGISDNDDGRKGGIVANRRRRIARRILAHFVKLKISGSQSDSTVQHGRSRQVAIPDAEKKATAENLASKQPCHKTLECKAEKTKAATFGSSPSLSSSGRKNPVASGSDGSLAGRRTDKGTRNCICATLVYLLPISLTMLVLWGRLCAILWTCSCLYCVIRSKSQESQKDRLANANSPEIVKKPLEKDGIDYKKRVIMEGLLERSHHRV